jgi:hypothetical protein
MLLSKPWLVQGFLSQAVPDWIAIVMKPERQICLTNGERLTASANEHYFCQSLFFELVDCSSRDPPFRRISFVPGQPTFLPGDFG